MAQAVVDFTSKPIAFFCDGQIFDLGGKFPQPGIGRFQVTNQAVDLVAGLFFTNGNLGEDHDEKNTGDEDGQGG